MNSSLPVSVNIVVNDPQCAAYMSNVGIFIMYYCEQCGLASRSLWDITNHLAANSQEHVNSSGRNVKNSIDSVIHYLNSQLGVREGQTMPTLSGENQNIIIRTTDVETYTSFGDKQDVVSSESDNWKHGEVSVELETDKMANLDTSVPNEKETNHCNSDNETQPLNNMHSYIQEGCHEHVVNIQSCTSDVYNKAENHLQVESNQSVVNMHLYRSVDLNKHENIIYSFTEDDPNDMDYVPVTEKEFQNFIMTDRKYQDKNFESDSFNINDKKTNKSSEKDNICNKPTDRSKVTADVNPNDDKRGENITEGFINKDSVHETYHDEMDERIMYVIGDTTDMTAKPSHVDDSEFPILLDAKEKELFFTSYIAFVRECVDVTLFSNQTKIMDTYRESVINKVVKYDKNRFKTKGKTVDFIFTHPLRNASENELSCEKCPRWPFSSQKEFDVHMECHSETVEGFQFECYICKKWKILNVMRSATREWSEMMSHLMNDHKEMLNPITCSHCALEFHNQNELRDHRNLIHKEFCIYKTNGCNFCTFSSTESKLHNICHYLGNKNSGDFKCTNCPFFVSASIKCSWLTLRQHIARKHPDLLDPTNMCPGCNCNFLDQDTFLNHYVTCKRMDHVRHRCLMCTQSKDIILPNLERHLIEHIYSEKKSSQHRIRKIVDLLKLKTPMLTIYSMYCKPQLVENICMKEDNTSVNAASAENVHIENKEDSFSASDTQNEDQSETNNVQQSPNSSFQVKLCQTQRRNMTDLLNHVDKSHPEGTADQDESTSDYLTRKRSTDDLSAYESNVQVLPDGTFRCKLCYKIRKNATKFIRHMANSHPNGTDETTCDQCGKVFRTKSLYRNHYFYKHQGNKRKALPKVKEKNPKTKKIYKCEKCSYTTPHTTRLRNHTMSVHMGVMPYHCTMCTYQSNELSDMKRHKNNHFGIKQHACEHCDYKAKQYWLLKTHCWKQHFVRLPSKRSTLKSSSVLLGTAGSLRRSKNKTLSKHSTIKAADKINILDLKKQIYPPNVVGSVKPDELINPQGLWNSSDINDGSKPTVNTAIHKYHSRGVIHPGTNPKIYQVMAVENANKQNDNNKILKFQDNVGRTVPVNSSRGIYQPPRSMPNANTTGINSTQISGNTHHGRIMAFKLDNSDNNTISSVKPINAELSGESIAQVQDNDLQIQILRFDDHCNVETANIINDNVTVLQFDDCDSSSPNAVNCNRLSLPITKATRGSNNHENQTHIVRIENEENVCIEQSDIPVYVIPEGTIVESTTEVEYHVVIDDSTINQ